MTIDCWAVRNAQVITMVAALQCRKTPTCLSSLEKRDIGNKRGLDGLRENEPQHRGQETSTYWQEAGPSHR